MDGNGWETRNGGGPGVYIPIGIWKEGFGFAID